jgi:hypothetical protein
MRSRGIATLLLVIGPVAASTAGGCVSAYRQTVGGEGARNFERIYLTDYNTAWQSVLDSIKNMRLDVSNREGGFIQTKWTDNTAEKNFTDSFGGADSYLQAQYRFKIIAAKGFYNGQPSVKVSIQREQMIKRDVLEGWRPIESDTIEENTLLYRVGRIIYVRMKI